LEGAGEKAGYISGCIRLALLNYLPAEKEDGLLNTSHALLFIGINFSANR